MNFKKLSRVVDHNNPLQVALNSLLAEEFQAWYQYFIVSKFLIGQDRASIQEFFEKTADDELSDHATKLIERLNQLGLICTLTTPDTWKMNAVSKFSTASCNVMDQLNLNVQAEMEAIDHYNSAILLCEQLKDYVTQDLLKGILADEEEHLAELRDFINDIAASAT